MATGAILSQILRIKVGRNFNLASSAFSALRQTAVQRGVKEQYYGVDTGDTETILWVIQWPETAKNADLHEEARVLDVNQSPKSWFVPFKDPSQARIGLTAPCCQLCTVVLKPETDRESLMGSLTKTFTDCYEAPGFPGGDWGTDTKDDRTNWYYLGWESRQHHDTYATTDLFWVEINNLTPHMADGFTHYMKMTQQLD